MFRSLAVAAALTLFAAGCTSEAPAGKPPSNADAHDHAQGDHGHAHVHDVACGCSLAGLPVPGCGNYIEVDGEFVPLTGDIGLGVMEFCGKKDLKAEVEGSMREGKFVARTFKLVK